jgi:UDP-N-acetyl-L-fucosamine synthase
MTDSGLRVMTIVGTRPEIIRLSRVIPLLDKYTDHVLVHTGQNYDYELSEVFLKDLDIRRPDHFLEAAGSSPAETVGAVIARSDALMQKLAPEALLILGDTNSALSAYSAKRQRIPVFHMEAGNRSFDDRVPEEINRRMVDHISDINLPYSLIAREHLLREGLPSARIIRTGSPMYEVLAHYRPMIDASTILDAFELTRCSYFLVSCHREENVDSPERFRGLIEMLNGIAVEFGKRVIVSTHPRTRKRFDAEGVICHPLVQLSRPFGFLDYVQLQIHAQAVLSDSGTITEESSILNFPALNIRDSHERPEGMEEGAVMRTGVYLKPVLRALRVLDKQPRGDDRMLRMVQDYDAPKVSEKVLRVIHSYTSYVQETVWRRDPRHG